MWPLGSELARSAGSVGGEKLRRADLELDCRRMFPAPTHGSRQEIRRVWLSLEATLQIPKARRTLALQAPTTPIPTSNPLPEFAARAERSNPAAEKEPLR